MSWGSCTSYTALVLEGSHTSHPVIVEGSHFGSHSISLLFVESNSALCLDGCDLCFPLFLYILKAVDLLVGSGGVEKGHCHGQFVVLFFVVEQFAVAVVVFGKIMGVS